MTSLISTSSQPVVYIYNQDFGAISTLDGISAMYASVYESSQTFTHPLEDSTNVIDHRIIDPIEISIEMFLPANQFVSLYNQFKTLFLDASVVVVKTKTGFYQNMILEEMPHEEKPDVFDALVLDLRFKEVQIAETEVSFAPVDETQSSTVDRGRQEGQETDSPRDRTLLNQAFGVII